VGLAGAVELTVTTVTIGHERAMYFDGTGAPKNERRGAELFRRACEGGEAIGCKNLGIAYRDGRGVTENAELAREYEAKSVDSRAGGGASGH
jgi:TPR repeat protein